jgi:hypothetical protein
LGPEGRPRPGLRLGAGGRTTKDIDLVRQDDEEAATSDLLAAQNVDLGDFFAFSVEKVRGLEDAEGDAVRYRVGAELGGRLFEEVLVDVGFSDPLGWQPERLRGPDLLAFAGIDPAEVPALPLEQQVAEKVHAYTRTYGGRQASSRVKDLVDLVLVKRSLTLDAARLRRALEVTFESRGSQALPGSLPPPPSDWAVAYRKQAAEVGIDADVGVGVSEAAALLDPVLAGLGNGRWYPELGRWSE